MESVLKHIRSWRELLTLDANDLLRVATYRRLWLSILVSSLGGQVTMLALPLTAAVLLHATPTQMGLLTAMEIAPFVLFSLPSGVWLDRVRKLPVYVGGEIALALTVASVPLAWVLGVLTMPWMYFVAFALGTVFTTAGSAAQIVLTQVVSRERLVEAHAKNALASSGCGGGRSGSGGAADPRGRRAGGAAGRCRDVAVVGVDPARRARDRAAHAASPMRTSGAICGPGCGSSPAPGCWWRWPPSWAAGRCSTKPRWW